MFYFIAVRVHVCLILILNPHLAALAARLALANSTRSLNFAPTPAGFVCFISAVSGSLSHGSAAAVLVNTLSTVNARMGLRSMVPPMGGMIPLKRLRYGSHRVESGYTIAWGGFGNQVRMSLPMSSVL